MFFIFKDQSGWYHCKYKMCVKEILIPIFIHPSVNFLILTLNANFISDLKVYDTIQQNDSYYYNLTSVLMVLTDFSRPVSFCLFLTLANIFRVADVNIPFASDRFLKKEWKCDKYCTRPAVVNFRLLKNCPIRTLYIGWNVLIGCFF